MAAATHDVFFKGDLFAEHFVTREDVILGIGASGNVLEAECRRTGRKAAVKSYKLREMSRRQLRSLGGELGVLAKLRHPGIVNVEGIYEAEEEIHIVTERLFGGELYDRVLDAGQFCEEKAILVTRQLLETLAYMHARNLVHRDVKLENVLFEE